MGSRRRSLAAAGDPRAIATLVALAIVTLAYLAANSGARTPATHGAQALAVPGGFDLLETDPQQTVFRFQGMTAIPPGFFARRARAFTGAIHFGGVPIGRFRGKRTGPTDSVVQRLDSVAVPADGTASPAIRTRLIRLSLQAIAPIRVRVGRSFQRWDVRATISSARPSAGQLVLYRTTAIGGTLDSQLTVYPKFTFKRLSDGRTKVLDVGALPDGLRPDVVLMAHATPWRTGCVAPALRIAGLNDRFCASFSPYPTLPARPLDSYRCYRVRPRGRYRRRSVRLRGQPGLRRVKLGRPVSLCAPAQTGSVPIERPIPKLVCQRIVHARRVRRSVVVTDRFTRHRRVRLLRPRTLCTPSLMVAPRPRLGAAQEYGLRDFGPAMSSEEAQQASHAIWPPVPFPAVFVCYATDRSGGPGREVAVEDGLAAGSTTVGAGSDVCNPTGEDGQPAEDVGDALRCYAARGGPVNQTVQVRNQFGPAAVEVLAPQQLCPPATEPAVDKSGCDPVDITVATSGVTEMVWGPIRSYGLGGGHLPLGSINPDGRPELRLATGFGFEVKASVIGDPSKCTVHQAIQHTSFYMTEKDGFRTWRDTYPPGTGTAGAQFHEDDPEPANLLRPDGPNPDGTRSIFYVDYPAVLRSAKGPFTQQHGPVASAESHANVIVSVSGTEAPDPSGLEGAAGGPGETVFRRFSLCSAWHQPSGESPGSSTPPVGDGPDAKLPPEAEPTNLAPGDHEVEETALQVAGCG